MGLVTLGCTKFRWLPLPPRLMKPACSSSATSSLSLGGTGSDSSMSHNARVKRAPRSEATRAPGSVADGALCPNAQLERICTCTLMKHDFPRAIHSLPDRAAQGLDLRDSQT